MSEATLDAALEPLRTKEEAYEKARTAAEAQISLAESAVSQAQRYVQGRRGAIDLELRSTLNNAETALSTAQRSPRRDDPEAASTHAMNARALADSVMATPIQNFRRVVGAAPPRANSGSCAGSSWATSSCGRRCSQIPVRATETTSTPPTAAPARPDPAGPSLPAAAPTGARASSGCRLGFRAAMVLRLRQLLSFAPPARPVHSFVCRPHGVLVASGNVSESPHSSSYFLVN